MILQDFKALNICLVSVLALEKAGENLHNWANMARSTARVNQWEVEMGTDHVPRAPGGKSANLTKLSVYGSPLLCMAPFFLLFAFPFLLPAPSCKAQDPVPFSSPLHAIICISTSLD